jgi:hypothetical protein
MNTTAINERREADRCETAYHEAGHFIVAKHFGLAVYSHLTDCGEPTDEKTSFTGQTVFGRTTLFRAAVIGWAGVLGEDMTGKLHDDWHENVDSIWDSHFPDDLSNTDLAAVNGHRMKRRAFNTAVRILSKNFNQVQAVASNLIAKGVHPWNARSITSQKIIP